MIMTPPLRNFTLTTHVIASVGWIGALAVFLALALASVLSQDEQMVRAASLAMGLTAWFVILPLSIASLTTGPVQALGIMAFLKKLFREKQVDYGFSGYSKPEKAMTSAC